MSDEKQVVAVDGLTLRDWFAGQVLPGCVTHLGVNQRNPESVQEVAQLAYTLADAMLLAREVQPEYEPLEKWRAKKLETLYPCAK
jgi:hypothetical protein